MRVLLQTYAYYPVGGGVSRSVEMLYRSLAEQGHQVRVATSNRVEMDPHTRYWLAPWVDAGVPGCRRFLFTPAQSGLKSRLQLVLGFLPYLAYLLYYRPQVVHLHFVNVDALFALWARSWLHFRLVTTCHGSDVGRHAHRCEQRLQFLRRVVRASDRVSTVSCELRQRLIQLVPEARVEVVPNAHPRLSPGGNRQPVFFFAGRLNEQKNPRLLLEAFAQIAAHYPEWQLALAGKGPLLAGLQARVAELGVHGRVQFLGELSVPQVHRWMQSAAALVVPSSYGEGCPHVVLEAMAAGLPVVAANVGGIPELVGPTGLLFESGNVEQLVGHLRRLASDRTWAHGLGQSALQQLGRFDPQRVLAQYLELYR